MAADDDPMICTLHPFKTTSPGVGICAFCLHDKLGQLVSSSNSPSFLPLSPPSSFRSELPSFSSSDAASTAARGGFGTASRLPFLLTPKKNDAALFLKRSKSTTASSSAVENARCGDYSATTPRRRGFWSFLHLSHKKPTKLGPGVARAPQTTTAPPQVVVVVEDDTDSSNESLNSNNTTTRTSFERKVSRSRSVGCGSRSFSGDILERISSGFGDCTLRRVESHREGGVKHRHSTSNAMREKVRCGGLFSGLMMIASSSSSSISTASSSSYWSGGKARSWGWSSASPRRGASSKPIDNTRSNIGNGQGQGQSQSQSQISGSNESNRNRNRKTPDLDAIPPLLSVRS